MCLSDSVALAAAKVLALHLPACHVRATLLLVLLLQLLHV
jgi:hypothetical protein